MLYLILKPLGFLLCKFLFQLKVTGREFIPKKRGVLVVSNHASYLDPVVLGSAFPGSLYFFAKSELFHNPLFGGLIRAVHAFPVHVDRFDKDAIQHAIGKLKEGKSLAVYPEGTRSRDGRLQPGQAGAGFFAVKAGVPVLPVYLRGTYEALPPGSRRLRPGKISVHFGKPLFFSASETPESSFQREGGGAGEKKVGRRQIYYQRIADQMMAAIQEMKDLTES